MTGPAELQLSLEFLLLVRLQRLFPAPIPPKLDPFRVLHRAEDQLSLRHLTGSLELKVRLSAAAEGFEASQSLIAACRQPKDDRWGHPASSLRNHGDVDQDLCRQAHDRLRIRLERVIAMLGPVEPRVVLRRQVGYEPLFDSGWRRMVKDWSVRVRGQEGFERERKELGDFVPIQVRLASGSFESPGQLLA